MKESEIRRLFLIGLVIVGLFYMFLAFNTDMLGEDEAIYYGLAGDMSNGVYDAFTSYFQWPQTLQPLLSLIAAPFFMIFGQSIGIIKAISGNSEYNPLLHFQVM